MFHFETEEREKLVNRLTPHEIKTQTDRGNDERVRSLALRLIKGILSQIGGVCVLP